MIRIILAAAAGLVALISYALYTHPPLASALLFWSQVAMWSCLALPFVALAGFGLWMRHRALRRDRTMVDGAWLLQRYRVRMWRQDLPWLLALCEYIIGYPGELDRNRIASPAWYVRRDGLVVEHEPAAGWALQHAYNVEVERTNWIRAAMPGDDVLNTPYGQHAVPPRPPTPRTPRPTVPQLSGPAEDDAVVDGDYTPVQMPFVEALHSGNRTEMVLGQSEDGNVVLWDVQQAPHIRVHGKTQGSGKTNLIKQLALCALRAGHHVIVLDRRAFKDWSDYRRHVELVDNRRPGAFMATAQAICTIYQDRDGALGEAGAENIEALPDTPGRVFLVISEFGSAIRELPDDERAEVVAVLKTIISEAGATGVHLVMEDQTNSKWPREIRGNAEPVTGYLPEDTAAAGGWRNAHTLDRYEFHYDGERFRTWDMKAEAPRLLTGMRPNGETMVDVEAFGVRSGENNSEEGENGANSIVFTPNEHRTNGDTTELQRLVWAWRDANPNGTQADLRHEFRRRGIKIARGYAHQCWHDWPGLPLDKLNEEMTIDELEELGIGLNAIQIDAAKYNSARLYTTNGKH